MAADDFLGACYRKTMTPKKLWTLLFPQWRFGPREPRKKSDKTIADVFHDRGGWAFGSLRSSSSTEGSSHPMSTKKRHLHWRSPTLRGTCALRYRSGRHYYVVSSNPTLWRFPVLETSKSLCSRTKNQPKEEVFGTDVPRTSGGHSRGYPEPKLRSGPSKLWKYKHFSVDIHDLKARMSTTLRGFQKLRSEKLWAEYSFPICEINPDFLSSEIDQQCAN